MINLTKENWKTITNINRQVNFAIEYLSDQENYGVSDYWTIPKNGKGDCDDYTCMKQDLLNQKGIPSFIATCWVEIGGYHAVLLVDTDRGTFVLDNRQKAVWGYDDLPYKWHKRECEDGQWRRILS